jgi:hypothetical protein
MPQMSVWKFLQGSALAALAAVTVTATLPSAASARPEGEQRNAMQIRGERVQQATAQRQQQRAQRVEQRQRPAPQAARQAQPRPVQAERQGGRADRQAARVEQRGNPAARQLAQRDNQAARQARQGDRNRSYVDQTRNRNYTARNGDSRANGSWQRDRRDNDRNNTWQRDRRDNDRNNTWQRDRRDNDRNNDRWQNGRRDNDRNHRNWDRRWRDNNRYDWQRYRTTNRTVFHIGTYYSPYRNYRYRQFGVGATIGSLFYGSSYWIANPWQYRLPDVYGPYRWVRYYDDVLLVDIYTGQVVDVIHNFFW